MLRSEIVFIDADIEMMKWRKIHSPKLVHLSSLPFSIFYLYREEDCKNSPAELFLHMQIFCYQCVRPCKSPIWMTFMGFSASVLHVAKLLCYPSRGGCLSFLFRNALKGLCHDINIFLWPIKLNQYFLYMLWCFLKFSLSLLLRKTNAKFLLPSLKTLTNF